MVMRKVLLAAVGAMALVGSATVANAAVVVTVPTPAVYTPPTSGGLIGQVAGGATSNDTFTFTILGGAPSLFSGQLSTTSLLPNGQGNLNFSNIVLDGMAGLFTLTSTAGAPEQWSCCGPGGNGTVTLADSGTPHTLTYTVVNTSNVLGTYGGTFNFATAPVPEPATWAMMLLGFGGIGMAMRRRRKASGLLLQIA
jgi:hypothetical protein